jgi:DNA-binding transcriptional MerR regulator
MDLSRFISRQQLIKELDINPSTLWRWEQQGKIKRAGGIGNKVYYSRRHIEYALTKNV